MALEIIEFLSAPNLELAPRATLALFAAFPPWVQFQQPGSPAALVGRICHVLLLGGLLFTTAATSPLFWLTVSVFHFMWIVAAYFIADNHIYLQGYWFISLTIALWVGGEEGNAVLSIEARVLVGLCFGMAAWWKLVSCRFRRGSVFVQLLVHDPRFAPFAYWLSLIDNPSRTCHQLASSSLKRSLGGTERVPVPPRLQVFARWWAWTVIGIELMVAILFLWPSEALEMPRAAALILFVLATFTLLPIPTFGLTLLLMLFVTTSEPALRALGVIMTGVVTVAPTAALYLDRQARRFAKTAQSTSDSPSEPAMGPG